MNKSKHLLELQLNCAVSWQFKNETNSSFAFLKFKLYVVVVFDAFNAQHLQESAIRGSHDKLEYSLTHWGEVLSSASVFHKFVGVAIVKKLFMLWSWHTRSNIDLMEQNRMQLSIVG